MDGNNNLQGGQHNQSYDLDNENEFIPEWLTIRRVPHGDSYDKWLQEKYPGESTNRTPDPSQPEMTIEYRQWRNMGPEQQRQHSDHNSIISGEYGCFGQEVEWPDDQDEPNYFQVFGPLNANQMYPKRADYGLDFDSMPFDNNEKFTEIMGNFGYDLGKNITETSFDHQIWVVTRRPREQPDYQVYDIKEGQQYVCKVVSAKYFYDMEDTPKRTSSIINKMENESNILYSLYLLNKKKEKENDDNKNIIKVFDVFGIQDKNTGFYVFLASIMEKMEGSLDNLEEEYPDQDGELWFKYPDDLVVSITIQMTKAINFLHNEVPDWVYVHQAIKYENVLYTRQGDPRSYFKLADFEECFCYERSKIEQGQIFDIHDPSEPPYRTLLSSEEYWRANQSFENTGTLGGTLRTMPNDIYSVAALACFLLTGGDSRDALQKKIEWIRTEDMTIQPNYRFFELLRLMTLDDPEQRITAQQLVNHQFYKNIEQSVQFVFTQTSELN